MPLTSASGRARNASRRVGRRCGFTPRLRVSRRYPLVRQNDATDCGAAALATISLYHRRPVALENVRDLSGTGREGTNLLGLVQAAQKMGFAAQPVKGPYDGLFQVPLPAVVV